MKQLLNDVAEFHQGYGAPTHSRVVENVPEDRQRLRLHCILEEVGELLEAHGFEDDETQDHIKALQQLVKDRAPKVRHIDAADALIDIMYFCVGTGLEYGYPLDRAWEHVHASNMKKFPDGIALLDKNNKLKKPEGWVPHNMEKALEEETEAEWAYNHERWKGGPRRISLDFDGVLHQAISPWVNAQTIADPPVPGALEAVMAYKREGYRVIISSCRAGDPRGKRAIKAWLKEHGFPALPVTHEKPHASLYVDDHGHHFTGRNFPTVSDIRNFRPWTHKARQER